MNRVSAIIPARNEASRIGEVLRVLQNTPCIQEVIVVDDGSTDETSTIARMFEVFVVRNEVSKGKGGALEEGARAATGDVFFFCDADIYGLTPQIVEETIAPVTLMNVEMSIAARRSKRRSLGFGCSYAPLLDGQRALTRELWERIPMLFKKGYRVEASLNHHARSVVHREYDIFQARKEDKVGFFLGTYERYAMYGDIVFAHVVSRLQVK